MKSLDIYRNILVIDFDITNETIDILYTVNNNKDKYCTMLNVKVFPGLKDFNGKVRLQILKIERRSLGEIC